MNNVFKGFEEVPPNFSVLVRLSALLSDEYVQLSQVVSLIEVDPGLASSVVRLSNCAYFGSAEPVVSIEDAINRIGFSEVIKLVAIVCNKSFPGSSLTCYGISANELWVESLATAVFMEFLAYDAKVDPGMSYLIGLLRPIGRYPIGKKMAAVKPGERVPNTNSPHDIAKWERDNVGIDHAKIASRLLEQWGFSWEIHQPIASYLHPLLTTKTRKVACLLHVATLVAPCLIDPTNNSLSKLEFPQAVLNGCGLEREVVEGYISPALAWLRTTCNMVTEELKSVG